MESLLQVMAAKKRELSAVQAEKAGGSAPKKYLRRAEVENILYAQEKQKEKVKEQQKAAQEQQDSEATAQRSKKRKLESSAAAAAESAKELAEEATLSWPEMKRRLRELGAPVTLFGESDRERMARLRTAEHAAATRREDELGDGHATRNEFLDGKDDDDDEDNARDRAEDAAESELHRAAGGGGADASAEDTAGEDEQDDTALVYGFFKGMLRRWEQELADRPDHIKRTAQGKIATKTMKQCKDYIRPLFKLCKKRQVASDILPNLVQIVRFCKQGEFVQANDAYIKLAIGNAAWPIGVTMVGIHERTGREKINANKQAHVMNNEAQRKYITSVKRLISYAQSVANVLPSKKVN